MTTIKEHNVLTGEIIERPMTQEEQDYWARQEAEIIQQKNAKKELLDRLGITEEEAKLLLS